MKTRQIFFLIFISFLLFFSCARKNTLLRNDNIHFNQVNEIDKGLFKSIFLQNEKKILATGKGDIGLVIYDPQSKEILQLNDYYGAGTKFLLDQNEENIFFQTSKLIKNRRYSSIIMQSITDNKSRVIVENRRNLKLLNLSLNYVIYLDDDNIFSYDIDTGVSEKNPKNISVAYSDHDLNLVHYINGDKKILNPLGPGNYIWVDISPDKSRILFQKIGSGTYICDLKAKIIKELGRINYAKWIDDWIIGMDDQDDGHRYIKSDIFLINTKRNKKINLTENTDAIALYPAVSKDLDFLVFNDENGILYFTDLKDHKIK